VASRVVSLVTESGKLVCERCVLATTPLARMRGLLGRSDLPSGEGVLLRPAASVHTFFMRFPIDVAFLDKELRVVRVASNVAPWRTVADRRAKVILELPSGEAERRGLGPGAQLQYAA
jgi:uncharacterized protein